MKSTDIFISLAFALCIQLMAPYTALCADTIAHTAAVAPDTQSLNDTAIADDTLSSLPSVNADSLSKDSVKKAVRADSLLADSVTKISRRDSLLTEKSKAMAIYQTFPDAFDSLYHSGHMGRQTIFSSDVASISELTRMYPQLVAAPLSLSNNLNRPMVYGFPIPGLLMDADLGILFQATDAFSGSDRISSTQVCGLSLDPLLRLRMTPHVDDCVTPEFDAIWENGLFSENILNVRFVRPFSSNMSFGIFTNNRYFRSMNYSTKNDIKALYEYFVTDTNLLSQGGKNPLVEDQNTEMRFIVKGKNGERRTLSLSYHDEKNEIAYEHPDSSGNKSLRWDKIFQYGTIASAGFEGLRLSPLFMDAQLHIESGGHTRYSPYDFTQRLGRSNEYSLALRPYYAINGDTAFLNAGCARYDETVYDQSRNKTMREAVSVAGAHHATLFGMNAAISASVGQCMAYQKKLALNKNDWTGSLTAKIETSHQMARAFAVRACAPFPHIYDSVNTHSSLFSDMYESYGAEYFVRYKKIGLMTGVCGISGIDDFDSANVWPSNMPPYRQPRVSYMVSPLFGEWHGLSAASRWMFSDTRPYKKVQTSLSYKAHPLGGREHILLDLVYDYWSDRDTLTYGSNNNGDWNRKIHNLSLKTAVQIKTFSLFYKIDNILNRNYAYVPGYKMPGITFRWGVQWLLQG
jgi:hypothetical protein